MGANSTTVLDLFPGQVKVAVDANLTQSRQLSRWERFRVRIERLADKVGLGWPWARVRLTEPSSRFALIGDRLLCHPAQLEALKAQLAEGAPAVVPVTAGRFRFDAELGGASGEVLTYEGLIRDMEAIGCQAAKELTGAERYLAGRPSPFVLQGGAA
jgi:hypothetical protein